MQKARRSSRKCTSPSPSKIFFTDFNLDTWWWSLALHGTLLLALPSYKLLHVSGRCSWRSDNWKLSLSDQLNKVCCLLWKRQSVLQQVFRLMCMTPSPYVATELEEVFMRTVSGFAISKRQDLWKEKPPEWLLTFWLLHASLNSSQKQDKEMLEYLLL